MGNRFIRTSTISVAFILLLILAVACDPEAGKPTLEPPRESSPQASDTPNKGVVTDIIDGATIELESGGQTYRVRYLGVHLPEQGVIDESGNSLLRSALDYNRFLVGGREVELVRGQIDTDQQGNLLRYVYVGGELVNKTIIANGYATVSEFPSTFKFQTDFLIAEENARSDQRGVWTPNLPDVSDPPSEQPLPTRVAAFGGGTLPLPPGVGRSEFCEFTGTSQPAIKGNVDLQTGERVFHVPGSLLYKTTIIDVSQGDRWFCTESEALNSGWRRSQR